MGIKEQLRREYQLENMATPLGQQIKARFARHKDNRVNFPNYWLDLAKYLMPYKDDIFTINAPGEKKNLDIYDSSPIKYVRRLANALSTLLINPSQNWFGLTTGDPELDRDEEVRPWLNQAVKVIQSDLNDSNFYMTANELFQDIVVFGTGTQALERGENSFFHFDAFAIYRCVIGSNSREVVDLIYRTYRRTARQLVQEFGFEILESPEMEDVKEAFKRGDARLWEVLYAVEPKNVVMHPKRFSPHPFLAFHVLMKNGLVLKQDGFEEFPYQVPRWIKHPEEEYGRGPGMDALPDIMTLNSMKKVILQGGQLAIAPPVQATNNSVMNKFNLKPFGVTFRRPGSDPIAPIFTGARPDIGVDLLEMIKAGIKDHFFADQLQLVQKDRMTATEIIQRRDEDFRDLGGALIRLDKEYLSPMIDRGFNMEARAGRISPPPEKIARAKLKVRYTSPISRAMQAMEAENLNRAIASIGPVIQAAPQAMDLIDPDKAMRKALNDFDVDPSILRRPSELQEIRQARAQQEQQIAQAEQAKSEAEAINKLQG